MTTIVTILIVIGLIFIFGSFAISEKLVESKEEEEKAVNLELSEGQKAYIENQIDLITKEKLDDIQASSEEKLAEILNEKMLALGDYAVSVNENIERNHKEVVFLYEMLNSKQKEIQQDIKAANEAKVKVRKEVRSETAIENLERINAAKKSNHEEVVVEEETAKVPRAFRNISANQQPERNPALKKDLTEAAKASRNSKKSGKKISKREKVMRLYREGKEDIEIAKELKMGVGEVRLILEIEGGGED